MARANDTAGGAWRLKLPRKVGPITSQQPAPTSGGGGPTDDRRDQHRQHAATQQHRQHAATQQHRQHAATQQPAATMSPRRTSAPEGSDTMSPQHEAGAALKRKGDDGPGPPRAKRNRYISIACNECKRRKIKCNGQTPCQRCGNLSLECLYAPNCCNNFKESDEFKQMTAHIASLQQQVDDLYHGLAALRAHADAAPSNGSMGTPFTQHDYPPLLPAPPPPP
ncbi:fungal specific transcription factor domain-containing protein, partial [Stagonosporopsis vannaccii]